MNFKTDRLSFSLITHADQDDVFETLNSEHTAGIISFFHWPMDMEQAQFWCDKAVTGFENKTEYLFMVRQNDRAIGCISVHISKSAEAETGYWVAEKHQGRGYATEMLSGILEFSKNQLGIKEISASTVLNNPTSEHILLKNHFKYQGQEDLTLLNGTIRPSKIFSLKL